MAGMVGMAVTAEVEGIAVHGAWWCMVHGGAWCMVVHGAWCMSMVV